MTLIDLLSWDAFGSGWFWTLLLLQWFEHSLWVMGIPVDMLRSDDLGEISPIVKWRISRITGLVDGLHVLVITPIFAMVFVVMLLGLWYEIELFSALCFLILPEIMILWLGYGTTRKLHDLKELDPHHIKLINNLHYKIKAISAATLLLAAFLGYGYEVLL